MSNPPDPLHPRRPWLAAVANLFVPGLGLLYAGALSRAVIWAFVPIAASLLLAVVVLWLVLPPFNVFLIGCIAFAVPVAHLWVGWRAARRAPRPFAATPYNKGWIYFAFAVAVTLGGAVFLDGLYRPSFIQAYRFPGGSMEPTLRTGEYFFVLKERATTPKLNAVVVFESVEEPDLLITKRIVAVGGDTIAAIKGRLMRNGRFFSETYALPADSGSAADTLAVRMLRDLRNRFAPDDSSTWTLNDWGPLVVPLTDMFVLGDNRGQSYDSRYYGPVPAANIRGWPRVVYFSKDSTGVRWERLGQPIG